MGSVPYRGSGTEWSIDRIKQAIGSAQRWCTSAIEEGESVSEQHFNNVLIQGIMTVLIGGILIVLAGVIISDFIDIMPEEDSFIDQEDLINPLETALGLAAISLVVPIVAGVVALLMSSFGGIAGRRPPER